MKVDHQTVEHVAALARIELRQGEREAYTETLRSILAFFERLREVDTQDVPPTSHVLDLAGVTRPDRCAPSLDVDEALGNAPDRADRFYRVPKILD